MSNASKASIRFVAQDKNLFFNTLKTRVDAYFEEQKRSKNANPSIVIKSVLLFSAYLLPLVAISVFHPPIWLGLLLWAFMGFAMAGVGMSIMHDANHGAYSGSQGVNKLISYSLNFLGGSMFNWQLQHNNRHHTFTNIVHYDDDIADKTVIRLSPHTPVKPLHRYQSYFAILLYGITTLYWVTAKDFLQFSRYTREGINKDTPAQNRITMAKIIGVKIGYFMLFLGLPLFMGVPFLEILGGFLLMHFIGGVVLTVIFQLAHTVEETTFPQPNAEGLIENDWAVHQMNTTVDFCRNNRLLSWYVGGLNFQVEHHLFPRICHVHYPKLAPIVQRTAEEFNVPYLQHRSFWQAVRSHFSTLRRFGKMPDLNEVMG